MVQFNDKVWAKLCNNKLWFNIHWSKHYIIDLCTRQDTFYRFNFLICLVWPGQSNTAEWKLTSLSTSLQVSIFNTVPKDFVLVIDNIIWCRQGGEARDEHAQCGRHQQRGQGGSCQDITYIKLWKMHKPSYWNNNHHLSLEGGQHETYWWARTRGCHLLRRQSSQVVLVLLQSTQVVFLCSLLFHIRN